MVLSSRYSTGASTCIEIWVNYKWVSKDTAGSSVIFHLNHCECLTLDSFKLADSDISIYRNQPCVDVCRLTALWGLYYTCNESTICELPACFFGANIFSWFLQELCNRSWWRLICNLKLHNFSNYNLRWEWAGLGLKNTLNVPL